MSSKERLWKFLERNGLSLKMLCPLFPNLPHYLSTTLPKKRTSPSKRKKSCSTHSHDQSQASSIILDSSSAAEPEMLPLTTNSIPILQPLTVEVDIPLPSASSMCCAGSSSQASQVSHISPWELTKMKEKLNNCKKRLLQMKQQKKALNKENKKLRSEVEKYKEELKKYDVENIPPRQKLLIKQIFNASDCKHLKGMRYDPEWILECLLLRIRSPGTYEFLRENEYMPLPDRRTLSRYTKRIDATFGFNPELFSVLKEKLQDMPERERKGILMWDEVSLQRHVEFNKHTGHLTGLIELGDEVNSNSIGDHALVFLFQPHLKGWSQTIGTFCSKGAAPGNILSRLLIKAVINLEQCGAIVTNTVCDGSATNKSALEILGVCGDINNLQHTFENPVSEMDVFVIIDVPHSIKCLRNMLLKHNIFKLPYGDVQMEHFRALLTEEEKQLNGMRVVPKLKQAHVSPNNFQKMNVRLATQLFSASVANGLIYHQARKVESLLNCDATIKFVKFWNKLFGTNYVLNLKLPHTGLTKESDNLKVITNAIKELDYWECFVQSLPKTEQRFYLSKQTSASWRIT